MAHVTVKNAKTRPSRFNIDGNFTVEEWGLCWGSVGSPKGWRSEIMVGRREWDERLPDWSSARYDNMIGLMRAELADLEREKRQRALWKKHGKWRMGLGKLRNQHRKVSSKGFFAGPEPEPIRKELCRVNCNN